MRTQEKLLLNDPLVKGEFFKKSQGRWWVVLLTTRTLRARYVLAKHLNLFPLPSNVIVHHIDGNCLNDQISNLVLMTFSQHRKYHDQFRALKYGLRCSPNPKLYEKVKWEHIKKENLEKHNLETLKWYTKNRNKVNERRRERYKIKVKERAYGPNEDTGQIIIK